jgi:hypothetical protein
LKNEKPISSSTIFEATLSASTLTMLGLLSLQNEVLIHVFTSCTVESVMSLSKVNTRLHSIFLKYNKKITTSALKNEIPDFEEALDLAEIEQVWCSNNYPLTLTPFSEITARLFSNLDLATSATDALEAALQKACPPGADLPDTMKTLSPSHKSLHAAYYLMRKIVVAYEWPEAQLQNSLRATLRSYSEEEAGRLDEFYNFLMRTGADGVGKPFPEWREFEYAVDSERGYINSDAWDYVGRVINALVRDETKGQKMLELVLSVRGRPAVLLRSGLVSAFEYISPGGSERFSKCACMLSLVL